MRRIGACALISFSLGLCLAPTAFARVMVFWSNSTANKISYASPLEQGPGADLAINPAFIDTPYGTTIDAAAGRVYWLNRGGEGSIGYANLDGSGAGLLNTTGASFGDPSGLAIDPVGGRVYWGNPEPGQESIGYANLNGNGGGVIHISGAAAEPSALTIDPSLQRIYWSSSAANAISYANLDGGGAHDLDTTGAPVTGPKGVAIDPYTNRVYWTNQEGDSIGYANLDGGGGGKANPAQAIEKPVGLALEGNALYWADGGADRVRAGNFGGCCVVSLEITPGVTQSGVAFPVILESPRANAVVKVEGSHRPGSLLTCSTLPWGGDTIEAFRYLAPHSVSYQWFRDQKPIAGATGTTVTAGKVGKYLCQVTGANFAGANIEQNPHDFIVRAELDLKRTTLNRRRGTATVRVAVTGAGRLDAYGKGVANASRKHVSGTAKIVVRASGKALIKLRNTGKAKVKATIAYTPEGGKAIKRRKTVVLKKKPRR
jgi:hypothetical protein